jgi:microcystin degradation protein MlrC
MRLFYGAFGTETNTFSPVPMAIDAFDRDESRLQNEWAEILAPFYARSMKCVGGFRAFAEPGGRLTASAYDRLRDELLSRIGDALPVDFVLLLLHGAMAADGTDDCEGDLLERIRAMVGNEAIVGATLDPHCHLTRAMVASSDLLVIYKEYPHVDAQECARELGRKLIDIRDSGIRPAKAVYDCRTISLYYTNREPMRGYVDRLRALERSDGIFSISIAHGFPWGDVEEMGAKSLVYAPSPEIASRTARRLGDELIGFRGTTFDAATSLAEAITLAQRASGCVVLTERADNPGGGAPGDATYLLRALLENDVVDFAFGAIWDPAAVQACARAGIGNPIALRVGGKASPLSGTPVDIRGIVRAIANDFHTEVTGGPDADTGYGDVAVVDLGHGNALAIATRRSQVFVRSFFERLGIPLSSKRVVAVKSSNHFYADFAPIADRVIYVDTPGALSTDFTQIPYRCVRRPIWPLDSDALGRIAWPSDAE